MASSDEIVASNATTSNVTSSKVYFSFLELSPELQLEVYEILVTMPNAVRLGGLMPVGRHICELSYVDYIDDGIFPVAHPAITKVSRGVRNATLPLYYSLNKFIMKATVTAMRCIIPFTRYPTVSSADTLRHLRSIRCSMRLQDRSPTQVTPVLERHYNFDLNLKVSKSKKSLTVRFDSANDYNTPAYTEFLLEAVRKGVGEPEDDGYDGLYLLKAAVTLYDGVVYKDADLHWNEIDSYVKSAAMRDFVRILTQSKFPRPLTPIAALPSHMSNVNSAQANTSTRAHPNPATIIQSATAPSAPLPTQTPTQQQQ